MQSVRPGLTCAIFDPAPRAANLGRQPIPEASPWPERLERPQQAGKNKPPNLRRSRRGQDVGPTQQTKTDVVVAVVRVVVVAVGAAGIVLVVVPGPATHSPAVRHREPRAGNADTITLPQKAFFPN